MFRHNKRLNLVPLALIAGSVFTLFTGPANARLVSGDVSGEWTLLDNPVIAIGDCRIPTGRTLDINPGVRFLVNPGITLTVEGTLTAIGSSDYPVIIDANEPAVGPWRGIAVAPNGQAVISHANISGGGAPMAGTLGGMVTTSGGAESASVMTLKWCDISGSASSGVFQNGGTITLNGCRFHSNGGANPTDAAIHVVTGTLNMGRGDSFNSIENGVFGMYNEDVVPLDATGQWWGSSTGPQHAQNISGIGSSASDDVLYGAWVLYDPIPGLGDLDFDGSIGVSDVAYLMKVVAGLVEPQSGLSALADVVRDGNLNIQDISRLARASAGIAPL